MALTIKALNTRFYTHGIDSTTGLIPLYKEKKPGPEYIGSIRKDDNDKCFYIGYPTDKEIPVETLDDVSREVEDFIKACDENWVDRNACDLSWNNGYRVETALHYFARRMGWKACEYGHGHGYNVGATGWGVKVFNLDCDAHRAWSKVDSLNETKFILSLSDTVYIPSPVFTKYDDAMRWLKSTCWIVLFGAATEILNIASQLKPDRIDDAELKQLRFDNGIFPTEHTFSLRDHLIETLEKQLAILKRNKADDEAKEEETD